jgi:hypothetical protein
LNESWFDFSTTHERIWLAPGELVPDREWHMIWSFKLMITVAWNPSGFHVVTVLPNGTKFNTGYYTTKMLHSLKDWREKQGVGSARKLSVYADNVRPYMVK